MLAGASSAVALGRLMTGAGLAAAAEPGSPPPLGFESRVSEFTLDNGLHFIVLERHAAPVVSCHTHARVGAFVEQDGATGLAHLLEHLAFKGTPRIGSLDWPREERLLALQDEAFYELRALREAADASASGRSKSAAQRIEHLEGQLSRLQQEAEQLVVPNAFGSMLQEAGAVGLNAATSHDNTRYFVSLPSNKLELWFALESERFQVPTFRELYTEKEVIVEERRARWENSPVGSFTAAYLGEALDNPYARPVIGLPADFAALGSREVGAFHRRYYHPANLTVAVVGDVDPGRVQALAERYFGPWRAAPGAVALDTTAPALAREPLPGPATAAAAAAGGGGSGGGGPSGPFVRRSAAGPLLAMGYYRPSVTGRAGVALEVASDVLSGNRSSRLVQQLVLRGECLSASAVPGYPASLHPGLALVSAVPQPGGDLDRLAGKLQRQLDELADGGPSPAELARVKAAARMALLGALTSNMSMAAALSAYHAVSGSWRGVLRELHDVEALSAPEVAEAAGGVFAGANRFVGKAVPLA